MNDASLEHQWNSLLPEIRTKWGKLTEDDLNEIAGNHTRLAARIVLRYGCTEREAVQEVNQFCKENLLVVGSGGPAKRGATYPHSLGDPSSNPE